MNDNAIGEENQFEPVNTGDDRFGDWLSIEEAVLLSAGLGLPRTPKTIRKWAARSFGGPEGQAEVNVRKKDTSNGFRWMLERASVERKIREEINLLQQSGEPDETGVNLSEPVQTAEPIAKDDTESRAADNEPATAENIDEGFLRDQIDNKDKQIEQLNRMIGRKDDQIEALLERDRETNILIQGLQRTLSNTLGIEAPNTDRSAIAEPRDVTAEKPGILVEDETAGTSADDEAGGVTAEGVIPDGV